MWLSRNTICYRDILTSCFCWEDDLISQNTNDVACLLLFCCFLLLFFIVYSINLLLSNFAVNHTTYLTFNTRMITPGTCLKITYSSRVPVPLCWVDISTRFTCRFTHQIKMTEMTGYLYLTIVHYLQLLWYSLYR